MALILAFPQARSGRGGLRSGGRGEVVIFPGIRIEYHDDDREVVDLGRRLAPPERPGRRSRPLS